MRQLQPVIDFWVPQFKWQLVEWFQRRYPAELWNKKSKKQLTAIYINIRKKGKLWL